MSRFLIGCATFATLTMPWLTPLAAKTAGVAHAQDEPAPGGSAVVRHTEGGGLRLRSGPGLQHPVQVTLAEGARVQVVEGPETADGHQWYRVSAAAGSGWASARYLVVVGDRATLAAAGSAPAGRALQMRVVGYHFAASTSPRTATGTTPRWGTVAVDPRVIPLGSRLLIEGFEEMIYVDADTGGGICGNVVDVWLDALAAGRPLARQPRTATILER